MLVFSVIPFLGQPMLFTYAFFPDVGIMKKEAPQVVNVLTAFRNKSTTWPKKVGRRLFSVTSPLSGQPTLPSPIRRRKGRGRTLL